MAEDKKKVAGEVEQATTDTKKAAAAKVAKAAKGSSKPKEKKPNIFVRAGKAIKRFFKDFKGESKKIVWPDGKTVMKNTGIVILVVAIVAVAVFGIDYLLGFIIKSLQSLATSSAETTAAIAETTAEAVSTTAGTTAGSTAASAASGLIGFFAGFVG